jgi:catechol 2,3-dioxygenase-like lactoylglutathione lyase family enzyme
MSTMLSLDHIVIPVWNGDASLAFYRDVMGFALVDVHSGDDWGGHPWLMMIFAIGDGRECVLVNLRGVRRGSDNGLPDDVRHYAFSEEHKENLDAWRNRLRGADIVFWEEDHGEQHSLYFHDPNGVVLEVTAPPSCPATHANPDALATAQKWLAEASALTD